MPTGQEVSNQYNFPFGLVQRQSTQNIHVCKDVSIYGGTNSDRAELGYRRPIKSVVGYNQVKPQSYLIEFYDSLEQGRLLFKVELSIVTRATRSNDSHSSAKLSWRTGLW